MRFSRFYYQNLRDVNGYQWNSPYCHTHCAKKCSKVLINAHIKIFKNFNLSKLEKKESYLKNIKPLSSELLSKLGIPTYVMYFFAVAFILFHLSIFIGICLGLLPYFVRHVLAISNWCDLWVRTAMPFSLTLINFCMVDGMTGGDSGTLIIWTAPLSHLTIGPPVAFIRYAVTFIKHA